MLDNVGHVGFRDLTKAELLRQCIMKYKVANYKRASDTLYTL